jgi:hypothetical protein
MPVKQSAGVPSVHVVADELQTPRKGPYYSVIIAPGVRNFPGAHPSAKQIRNLPKSREAIVKVSPSVNQGDTNMNDNCEHFLSART